MATLLRRSFIKKAAINAGVLPLITSPLSLPLNGFWAKAPTEKLRVHIFSKHLQFLSYLEMADAAAQIGFDGVDLTVRPNGHVLPEEVNENLPKAIEAIGNAGLKPLMITTAVDDITDPLDQKVLRQAADLGVKYYRMNWLRYQDHRTIPESMAVYKQQLKSLASFNQKIGVVGCYQNHAGTLAGSSLFELHELLSLADNEFMGVQYDIRHATVEGGKSWENGLKLIAPRIKTLVLKDFKWEMKDGVWDTLNTPMGKGMVDFKRYFGLLKKYEINVPVSLHLEYPLGGAEHGATTISEGRDKVFQAMRNDLNFIHETWASA